MNRITQICGKLCERLGDDQEGKDMVDELFAEIDHLDTALGFLRNEMGALHEQLSITLNKDKRDNM